MSDQLTTEQRRLADLMSDLSERCYYAGWMANLEYVLWDTLATGERSYGHDIITQKDIDQLIQLSNNCNCWIYFNDTETAIDLDLWKQMFAEAVAGNPGILKG